MLDRKRFSNALLSQQFRVITRVISVIKKRYPVYDTWHKCRIETAGRQMIPNDTGIKLKSGKLSTGIRGRFRPESALGI